MKNKNEKDPVVKIIEDYKNKVGTIMRNYKIQFLIDMKNNNYNDDKLEAELREIIENYINDIEPNVITYRIIDIHTDLYGDSVSLKYNSLSIKEQTHKMILDLINYYNMLKKSYMRRPYTYKQLNELISQVPPEIDYEYYIHYIQAHRIKIIKCDKEVIIEYNISNNPKDKDIDDILLFWYKNNLEINGK